MHNTNQNFQQLEIPVIKKPYELYGYTHKMILKFPKHERYSLGEKLETTILETIELIVLGNAQPKNFKDNYLLKANAKIETLKLLYRLGFDIKAVPDKCYLKTQEYLQETGRMIGGWIKYLKSN